MKKLLLALLVLASTAAVTAQTTSTIEGTIRDPEGAVVAGATVTIAGPGFEAGRWRATLTGATGSSPFRPAATRSPLRAKGSPPAP